jgi:hypothetical protein
MNRNIFLKAIERAPNRREQPESRKLTLPMGDGKKPPPAGVQGRTKGIKTVDGTPSA